MTTRGKKSKYFTKMQKQQNKNTTKSKTLQEEQGRENNNNILYILCQAVWRAKKEKKEQDV